MKLVIPFKLCLNKTYSKVHPYNKHFPNVLPTKNGLKQGDAFQLCSRINQTEDPEK
jgi:hypothetical protein